MKFVDRNGHETEHKDMQIRILAFLYRKKAGRILLYQLVKPWFSNISGVILKSRCSRVLIPRFIKKYGIDMNDYEKRKYISYNDFFTRKIIEGKRPVDLQPDHLISPCDGKLSVYHISKDLLFIIKNTAYTLKSLLKDETLAEYYENGILLLFRLSVDDYHRYCYIDNGEKSKNHRIKGVFHTVNPIALEKVPVYKENTREYSVLNSENFGKMLIMEVGALMVGRIVNYHEDAVVKRGVEKGRFEYGGSTIIVCIEESKVIIDDDIMRNSMNGMETLVKMGEKIGNKAV